VVVRKRDKITLLITTHIQRAAGNRWLNAIVTDSVKTLAKKLSKTLNELKSQICLKLIMSMYCSENRLPVLGTLKGANFKEAALR